MQTVQISSEEQSRVAAASALAKEKIAAISDGAIAAISDGAQELTERIRAKSSEKIAEMASLTTEKFASCRSFTDEKSAQVRSFTNKKTAEIASFTNEKRGQVRSFTNEKYPEIASFTNEKTAQFASFTNETTAQIAKMAADPRVQVAAASGAGGAVVVGTGGAGVGFLAGGAVGVAVGIVPAVFTFGLSIPVFGAIGAGCGAAAGGAVGGTVGFTSAGALGYAKHAEIRRLVASLRHLPVEDAPEEPPQEEEEEEEEVDLRPVSQELAEIAAKLNATETSLTPWSEIRDLREQLGDMQQSIDQQIAGAGQRRTRRSLSNVAEQLAELNTSLDSAETSWTPWADLTNAKQHLGRAQDLAAQPDVKLVGA